VKDRVVSNMAACRAQSQQLSAKLQCKNGETGHPEHCLTRTQIERTIAIYHNGYTLPYAFAHGIRHYPRYNHRVDRQGAGRQHAAGTAGMDTQRTGERDEGRARFGHTGAAAQTPVARALTYIKRGQ
jgi:hypothetical protein